MVRPVGSQLPLWETYSWHDRAACRDADPELFFPASVNGQQDAALAKQWCAVCPVREACLRFALARPDTSGVWGGTTDQQRRMVRSGKLVLR